MNTRVGGTIPADIWRMQGSAVRDLTLPGNVSPSAVPDTTRLKANKTARCALQIVSLVTIKRPTVQVVTGDVFYKVSILLFTFFITYLYTKCVAMCHQVRR